MSDILTMRRKTVSSPLGSDPATVTQLSTVVTVTNVPTGLPAAPAPARSVIIIENNGSQTVYIGDITVTTAKGYPLAPGATFIADAAATIAFYGIVTAGNANVRIMELG